MCGIIVSTREVNPISFNFINNRGPDNTNIVNYNGIFFIHFLLHLTGEKTVQPIIKDKIICIFNGEIYNYKKINSQAKSDSYSIITAYENYEEEFVKMLDGEFAIVLFDFDKNKLIITGDIFKTKPLFYSLDKDDIIIASYESVCKSIKQQEYKQINPNETLVFDLVNRTLINRYQIYTFDLNQYKNSYIDFCDALEKAILKRYPENDIPLISLSSGVDSGAISCCLLKYNKPALYITINKNEDDTTLYQRKQLLKDSHKLIQLREEDKNIWQEYLSKECEPFTWDWTYHPNMRTYKPNGFLMGSMLGKCEIIKHSKQINNKIRVLYSGIGADEVMATNKFYSQGYGNVDIFPQDLSTVFPWPNFFNGSMENYIKGDEYIGGCFGFETRYPFCDKELVQEFLWLKPELKNEYKGSIYKPALCYYLEREYFPYHKIKYGFNV